MIYKKKCCRRLIKHLIHPSKPVSLKRKPPMARILRRSLRSSMVLVRWRNLRSNNIHQALKMGKSPSSCPILWQAAKVALIQGKYLKIKRIQPVKRWHCSQCWRARKVRRLLVRQIHWIIISKRSSQDNKIHKSKLVSVLWIINALVKTPFKGLLSMLRYLSLKLYQDP